MGGYFSNSRLFQGLQLPPRPNFGSDTNGITGQGPLFDPSPDLPDLAQMPTQDDPGPMLRLPPPVQSGPSSLSLPDAPSGMNPDSSSDDPGAPGLSPALPAKPQIQSPQISLPAQPKTPTVPENPLIDQALNRAMTAPANLPPGAPTPSTKRQILGSLAATFKPTEAFAPLITYGRKGLEQERQRAEAVQNLPSIESAGRTAEALKGHQETAEGRSDSLGERMRNDDVKAYDAKMTNLQRRKAKTYTPGQPIPEGHSTPISVFNPSSKQTEQYVVPNPDQAAREDYLAKTEPTPEPLKKQFPGIPDRMSASTIAAYQRQVELGNQAEANRILKTEAQTQHADLLKTLKQMDIDSRKAIADSKSTEVGTWTLQEDANGNTVEYNSKTGKTRTAPAELKPRGTKAKSDAATEKEIAPARNAINYAQDYLKNGVFTGPGDEALQEKFFELARPSVGFRMTQPQIDMLQKSRGWMQGAAAKAHHAIKGTWFDDNQRGQIVQTMNDLAKAKGATGAPGPAKPTGGDPLGIR